MYKFVIIAKMTMNRMRINEIGFSSRTNTFAVLGMNRWIKRPMPNGISSPKAVVTMRAYGTPILARLKIVLPSVKIQSGIIRKAASVEIVVIAMDKLMLPPSIRVHMLLAPPPGDIPVKNNPSASSWESGKSA